MVPLTRSGRGRTWVILAAAIVIFLAAAFMCTKRSTANGDTKIFFEAAREIWRGDPYRDSSIGAGYLYPPFFAILIAPLAYIPPVAANAAWFVLNAASLLALFAFSYYLIEGPAERFRSWLRAKLAALAQGRFSFIVVAAVLASGRFWFENLSYGQINIPLAALSLAGIYFCLTRRDLAGALLLGLAIAIKPYAGAALAFLLYRRAWRGALLTLPVVAALFLAPVAALGWGHNAELLTSWYRNVIRSAAVEFYFYADPYNQSLPSLVYRYCHFTGLNDPHTFLGAALAFRTYARILGLLLSAVMAFFFVRGWRLGARADKAEAPLYLALITMTSVFLQPLAWVTYYIVAAFPYMAAFFAARRASRPIRVIAYVALTLSALGHTFATDMWGADARLVIYDYKAVVWAMLLLYGVVVFLLAAGRGAGRQAAAAAETPAG